MAHPQGCSNFEGEVKAAPRKSLVVNKKFQPHKKGVIQTIVVNKLGGDSLLFEVPSRTTILQLREIIAARHQIASNRVHLFANDGELIGNQYAPPDLNLMLYNGGEWQAEYEGMSYELSVVGHYFCLSCRITDMNLEGRVHGMTVDDADLEITNDGRFDAKTSLVGTKVLFSRQEDGGLRGEVPVKRCRLGKSYEWKMVTLQTASL